MEKKDRFVTWCNIKKHFKKDYFRLTVFYFIYYSLISLVLTCGFDHLIDSWVSDHNPNIIITSSLVMTMGKMFRKLQLDLLKYQ